MKKELKREKLVCANCGSDELTYSGRKVYTTDNEDDFGDDIWFCQNCNQSSDFITEDEFRNNDLIQKAKDFVYKEIGLYIQRNSPFEKMFHKSIPVIGYTNTVQLFIATHLVRRIIPPEMWDGDTFTKEQKIILINRQIELLFSE